MVKSIKFSEKWFLLVISLYLQVDHGQRHILTACQDRNIRVYNVNTGKHSKTFKGTIGDDGTLIKV